MPSAGVASASSEKRSPEEGFGHTKSNYWLVEVMKKPQATTWETHCGTGYLEPALWKEAQMAKGKKNTDVLLDVLIKRLSGAL